MKIYLDVLKENPNDVDVLMSLAEIYTRRNSKSEAIDAYLRMAEVYKNEGKLDDLARCYEKILEISPYNFAALKMSVEIFVKLGDKERLIDSLLRLARLFSARRLGATAWNLLVPVLFLCHGYLVAG